MSPHSQAARLLSWLRANPGATGMELVTVLRIPKYTSRISDLRKAGYVIECTRGEDHVDRYRVVESEPVQVALFFAESA